jgi:hypothetical protein
LKARRGAAKTIVAVANKNARVIFAMLKKGNGIPGGLTAIRGGVNDQRSVPADETGA